MSAGERTRQELVFGTSSRTSATNPRDGFHGDYPAGVGHAVPSGQSAALCGRTPPYLWTGAFDPGSRVLEVCPDCAALAR